MEIAIDSLRTFDEFIGEGGGGKVEGEEGGLLIRMLRRGGDARAAYRHAKRIMSVSESPPCAIEPPILNLMRIMSVSESPLFFPEP
jgi:hypothetical protein